ncbi:uncharacterized protein LOC143241657 isoform X1 [Tachypleus tridentatus]|uniref:uncharacterized protein LOC143241657 isoform X1 n=1 Tax=Tachypleus tridentatus TaxID=6853 RepID=UPI003FD3AA0D
MLTGKCNAVHVKMALFQIGTKNAEDVSNQANVLILSINEVSEDGMVPPGQYKYPVAIELTLSGPFATSRSPPSSQTHCMGIQLIERTLYRSLAIKYSSTHNHTAVAFDPIENFNQKNILIYNLLLKNTVVLTKFIGQFLFHKPL